MEVPSPHDRIKFYGPADLGNFFVADAAVALMRAQAERDAIGSLNDALELHNALELERHGILPPALTEDERVALKTASRALRAQIATFFATITSSNLGGHLVGLEYEYAQDLLQLIDRFKVAKQVGGQDLFEALRLAGIPLWVMLKDKGFVKAHDSRLRDLMMSDASYGELLVNARLVLNSTDDYFLPASLTPDDSQAVFRQYIESESPHLNYVEAIANAQDDPTIGITPRIRLAAQRRAAALTEELFADERNVVRGTSYAVGIDSDQQEPVKDLVTRVGDRTLRQRTLGGAYLKESMKPDEILANFTTIIGYFEERGLLTLPSFQSRIGALERLRISGKATYPRGAEFARRDSLTMLSTKAYVDFLQHGGTEIEDVLAWYFREYITEVFGIAGFTYAASTAGSSFLERCRHICAEMESIAKQFTLYCDDGAIDRGLLEMTSAPRSWGTIPSLVERKYVVQSRSEDCATALKLLFSDQSSIHFINKDLKASNFVQLVLNHRLRYDDLHHYQTGAVDWLVAKGLVAVDDGVITFRSFMPILVLRDINMWEAGPFGHYTAETAAAESLVAAGWLDFRSTLLSPAEASYFNFFLNKSEFSDGYDLRNRYLHGTNPNPEDEDAHRTAYILLVRLTVSLVLKIHDELALRATATE